MISNKLTRVSLVTGFDRREHELSLEMLFLNNHKNYVAQHHICNSEVTNILMKTFNIKPIVLVRNIFDVIMSTKDHLEKEGTVMPMAYIPTNWNELNENIKYDFITNMVVPWYIKFYVSWSKYDADSIITYNELISNPSKILATIFPTMKKDTIEKYVENTKLKNNRLNKGVSGRGGTLPATLRDKIIRMTYYYPDVDFDKILCDCDITQSSKEQQNNQRVVESKE
jgi:hypothetical protein